MCIWQTILTHANSDEVLKCLRALPAEDFMIAMSLRLVFFWHLSETGPALIHDGINFKEPNVGSFMEVFQTLCTRVE